MTATITPEHTPVARRVSVARGYRFELVKLVSQWRIRVLVLACWIAPALFVAAVSRQSSLPVDTLFGRWMHATGWAGPLVMLGFAGTWALPLLTSVVAGDVFAAEDRLGTWRHLLVAVRSPRRLFVAKGLLLPALVALALQRAEMLPLPVAVRLALPGYAFIAWNGLFTSPAQLGPLLIGVVVSVAWAIAATTLAYRLFQRRDFTNPTYDGSARRAVTVGVLPLVALVAVTVIVIAATTASTGSGIEQDKVQGSLATAFAHLYRVQTKQLNRPDVTEAELSASAACNKGGGQFDAQGPGNDWRCVVSWHLPGVEAVGTATYQLDINADGRYVADG
jgi:hypothetical protein